MRFLSVDDFISFLSMEDSLIMAIAAEGGNKLSMVLRFSASLQAFSKLYHLSAETKKRKVKWAPCWTAVYVHVDLSKICANLGLKVSATLQDSPRADRCSVSCFYKNPYKPYRRRSSFLGFCCTEYLSKQKLCSCCCFCFFFHSSCGSATIKT